MPKLLSNTRTVTYIREMNFLTSHFSFGSEQDRTETNKMYACNG